MVKNNSIPAFGTRVEHCLTFISTSELHGMEGHFRITTLGTALFDLGTFVRSCSFACYCLLEDIAVLAFFAESA